MAMKVLVGTDGSSTAQVALRWASALVAAVGAELTIATAWSPPFAEMDRMARGEHRERARELLEDDWCRATRDAHVRYRALVLEGDPRTALAAWATEHAADLIVVGLRGDSSDRGHGPHLGHVTNYLAHNTNRPLVSVPPTDGWQLPGRIVVGVDGSEPSAQAIEWCVEYGRPLRAEVVAVHAERPFAEWRPRTDPKGWRHRTEDACRAWAAALTESEVSGTTRVVEHEAATGLLDVVTTEQADLLVVGTRGRGGFAELVLGSTALRVLHRSDVPVVLVPAAS